MNAVDIPLSLLQWIVLLYLVFGVIYGLATPVFEANDEIWHFGYVQHWRETGSLPVQIFDGSDSIYRQHGSQPPLYYGLMALLTSPLNIDDVEDYRRLNPHVNANAPDSYGNKNLVIHDENLSPLRATGLVVLLIRGLSLALGAGTVVCVYKIGELVAPQRPTVAFVAAAITGLNPMFIFVSASVNNDALSAALNSALVLLMLRMIRDGFTVRNSVLLALLFALSCLTKLTALALLPVLIGVCLYVYRKTRDRRGVILFLYLLAFFWLVIAGWWFVRNIQLYGEPLGIVMMSNIAGPRGMGFNPVELFAEFQQFRMSYWGLFGALNIRLAGIVYVIFDLATVLSIVGCGFLIMQLLAISDFAYARYELTHLLTLGSALVLLWIGVMVWSLLSPALEGRMLFPLIAVVSPLLAVGLVEIVWWIVFSLRPPSLDFVRAGDAVPKELLHDTMLWQLRFLGLVALVAPMTVIASQYGAPQPVAEVPANASTLYAEFGDVALVAYERVDRRYNAGDGVQLKLYWQVLAQSRTDNNILLQLVDDRGQQVGQYVTYPGAGSLRTSSWQAGAIYPDEYLIKIHQYASGRYPFDLQVEWENVEDFELIEATDGDGQRIAPVRLNVGAVVTTGQQVISSDFNAIPADSQPVFDDAIRLESFDLDLDLNEITLSWKAEASPEENYTVFVHLLDAEGEILAQADASPRLPTKYWRWGEAYNTHHRLSDAFNMIDHRVIVGLYLNDGLTYPKAEYTLQPATDVDPALAPVAPAVAIGPDTSDMTADASDLAEETGSDGDAHTGEDAAAEDAGDQEIQVLDSYTIPWDVAEEVIALTPTPEATVEGGNPDEGVADVAVPEDVEATAMKTEVEG